MDDSLKYIYYITPKCGTRSLFKFFSYKPQGSRNIHFNHDNYFTWTFVRNPFSRVVSAYQNKIYEPYRFGLEEFRHLSSFKDFIFAINKIDCDHCDRHIRSLHTLFPKNIDFTGKIENFKNDFGYICDRIKIPMQKLPHENKTQHKHYTEYYDDETREIIAKKYSKDIKLFGYEFGK